MKVWRADLKKKLLQSSLLSFDDFGMVYLQYYKHLFEFAMLTNKKILALYKKNDSSR